MQLIRYVLCAVSAFGKLPAGAQTDSIQSRKTTTNVKMIGIGSVHVLDTYLSSERYSGPSIRYISHTTHQQDSSRLSRQIVHEGSLAYPKNRAENARELYAMYHFQYGVHYNQTFFNRQVNLQIGAQLNTDLGILYNLRNSNNPMQAKAGICIVPSAIVSYRFSIAKQPFMARYEIGIPMLGIQFSPQYGQSYYEIFSRGHYDHNLVATHIGNAPSLRHMLTLDFSVFKSTFRIGYLGDYRQAEMNHLKYHAYAHSIVLGVVKKFKLTHIRP